MTQRFALICLLACSSVFAENSVKTEALSFDRPEGWKCEFSQKVHICQSAAEKDRRESVILVITAPVTEWDTLDNYLFYLKQSRSLRDEMGTEIISKVSYARKRNINGHDWVDSLQHDSELPGFWTRYLSTVVSNSQQKLAVLVTYVVSDDHYDALAPVFERMVGSLKPDYEFNLGTPTAGGNALTGSERLGPNTRELIAERLNVKKKAAATTDDSGDDGSMLLVVGLLAVVVGYVIYRRRKKPKAPPTH